MMERQENEPNELQAEDFRRLGIRVHEWRATVIRRATMRAAGQLAQRQLESPTERDGRELSRVTVAAYRVLDPRRRADTGHRVSVGRILPLELNSAGDNLFTQRNFDEFSGALFAGVFAPLDVEPSLARSQRLAAAFDLDHGVARRLESDSLLRRTPWGRTVGRLRSEIQRPAFVIGLMLLVTGATVWVQRMKLQPTTLSSISIDVSVTDEVPLLAAQQSASPREWKSEWKSGQPSKVASLHREDEPTPQPASDPPSFNLATQVLVANEPDSAAISDPPQSGLVQEEWGRRAIDWWERTQGTRRQIRNAFVAAGRASPPIGVGDSILSSATTASTPAKELVLSGPPPVPSQTQVAEAYEQLRGRLPELNPPLTLFGAQALVKKLRQMQSTTAPGSADHWVAQLAIARAGWLIGDVAQVQDDLLALARTHQIPVEPWLADSYLNRFAFVDSREVHQHLLSGGFIVAEALLRSESLESCSKVVSLARVSAEYLVDAKSLSRLSDYQDAVSQMSRLRVKANEVSTWIAEDQVIAADAFIAGRYYCLFLRDWDRGLRWLAQSSDPRLAALAQAELTLRASDDAVVSRAPALLVDAESTEEQWSRIAARWVSLASRQEGRVAESMRLHALELLQQVVDSARGTRKLKLQREIDELRGRLSRLTPESQWFTSSTTWTL